MELREWVNPIYLVDDRVQKLARNYKKAKPFQHAALTAFLREEKAQELAAALKKQEFIRKESDLFSFQQTHDLLTVDDAVIGAFLDFVQSEAFIGFMQDVSGVDLSGEIDAMGAIYKDTDHLLCHDDQLSGRKIAYILNLSTNFTKHSGGALALLSSDKEGRPKVVKKRLLPEWNTLSFFTVTGASHHMVEEVLEERERVTIGGWLHG